MTYKRSIKCTTGIADFEENIVFYSYFVEISEVFCKTCLGVLKFYTLRFLKLLLVS